MWLSKPETARRVRQRIGAVLDWAFASGYRVPKLQGASADRRKIYFAGDAIHRRRPAAICRSEPGSRRSKISPSRPEPVVYLSSSKAIRQVARPGSGDWESLFSSRKWW
ncbi:phage integrase central domain-containing protein [Novosphingobium panipatense]|uniref:phage integrase central domain-containing protein n=1 Tax=Novosphingobium panipatense TaxID=428991 RepID=UPI0039A07752